MPKAGTEVFARHESTVRSYCRTFPAVFTTASGSEIYDAAGRRWIDFFAGAGALNYGHNPGFIKERLIQYLQANGISHALDMHTEAKRDFIKRFVEVVLRPRKLDYKLQFCGPTGANAVEAALKLVRKATGRTQVAAFSGGWHGMTSACLSVTSRREHRKTAGTALANVTMFPFPQGPRNFPGVIDFIEDTLSDSHSGIDIPAAFILETVQAEGGIYAASSGFLKELRALCDRHKILLIVDDVQAGCGRTGTFFSFENAGIVPDVVCLSKSIGGYGLPMSLVLIRPESDVWSPGEHTGTFRGHQLAFVAATAALDFWTDDRFAMEIRHKGDWIVERLRTELADCSDRLEIRGKGLLLGIDLCRSGGRRSAERIVERCFHSGLILENCGREGSVVKLIPPLTTPMRLLEEGLRILIRAIETTLAEYDRPAARVRDRVLLAQPEPVEP